MHLEDLKAFDKVCELGSFTKAAQALNFVQSSVTMKVQKLEAYYGTQLLYRDKKAIKPTAAGKALRIYIKDIFRLLDEAEQHISHNHQAQLNLGAIETITATHLPQILQHYHQCEPSVAVQFQTGSTQALVNKVKARELDCALISGEIEDQALVAETFTHEQMVVIASKALDVEQSNLTIPIIVFDHGCFYRTYFTSWLKYHDIEVSHMITLNTLDGMLGCVEGNLGIAMLPQSVIQRYPEHKFQCLAVSEPFLPVPLQIIYRKDLFQTDTIQNFINCVKS
ncbi:LysR family transcriptional regulator [Staphylococcus sp. 17KM0847]|uniref:LysR family transcriptional regulator n=1 Tax=Staphylococcus sp. 17KM0847 TaxID=2583989 RepID=UPI0015DC0EEF|nr:LysR family transcriptional regulator [Staphylococcus sp. 17KM0847]QLK85254.1 LysR family transcriptional regulator [Staphylococcus sp. 17KM0847]